MGNKMVLCVAVTVLVLATSPIVQGLSWPSKYFPSLSTFKKTCEVSDTNTCELEYPEVAEAPVTERKRWIQPVSWSPRAFIYHNFLTPEEARHIQQLAVKLMVRSTVVGANGSSVLDDYRTSYGTFIKRNFDPIISRIETRVAEWVKIPEVHQEDMQVLRYGLGQGYKVHMDTLKDEEAGPRVATILMYLNELEEGGETIFPYSNNWINPDVPKALGDVSECAQGAVGYKPKLGDALMFWSIHPDGFSEDEMSSHTACPVIKGFKWSAPKWVHAKPFRPATYDTEDPYDEDPGLCSDLDVKCSDWVEEGQCESNWDFMAGGVGAPGRCRKSCGACKVCGKGDVDCYNANRRQLGYLVYDPAEVGLDSLPI